MESEGKKDDYYEGFNMDKLRQDANKYMGENEDLAPVKMVR